MTNLEEFIKEASLQYYGKCSSDIKDENISFDGHTLKYARKLYTEKYKDIKFEEEERIKKLNKN